MIFCCHGGLSPSFKSMDQIRKMKRPTKVPMKGLLCDLLWSDPNETVTGYAKNVEREISVLFGPDVVAEFLRMHNLILIVRAHMNGYEFFAGRQLVTVFSAPDYKGEHDNAAAIMTIDQSLEFSFETLKHTAKGKDTVDWEESDDEPITGAKRARLSTQTE